jgi:hypothetical protein
VATKKKARGTVHDMKPKKQIKDGKLVKGDPCDGGEVTRRIARPIMVASSASDLLRCSVGPLAARITA